MRSTLTLIAPLLLASAAAPHADVTAYATAADNLAARFVSPPPSARPWVYWFWINGNDCGIAWKPPYRVDISGAARAGKNELEISAVNLWVNRLIGDEQLPLDGNWKDFETLLEWPEWFKSGKPRPSGRYMFTSCRHYEKDSPLVSSGLLGPVRLQTMSLR